jgi:hypothetical protein
MEQRLVMEQRLREAGAALAANRAERAVLAAQLAAVVRDAAAAGWPETRIAAAAGVERVTVRSYLGKRRPRP